MLEIEEEFVKKQCDDIIALKPDVIFTEKGVSDLAQHYLVKAGITAIRRVRKSDNNRIARACGATIVNRTEELQESDIGTGCGLFEIKKMGDEYFCFVTECKNPKACTILLRGASKDILNEIERNLQDALNVARNIFLSPRLVPGGGAIEMAISHALLQKGTHGPYKAIAHALGKHGGFHRKNIHFTYILYLSFLFRNYSPYFSAKLRCEHNPYLDRIAVEARSAHRCLKTMQLGYRRRKWSTCRTSNERTMGTVIG